MAALFIPLSLCCTFLILHLKQPQQLYRHLFLQSLILHSITILILTEGLSLLQQLTLVPLLLFWMLAILLQLIYLRRHFTTHHTKALITTLQQYLQSLQQDILFSPLKTLYLVSILGIVGICLLTALIAVPNNYDSLTYHMPRVMHWLQNQSVLHFPTNNLRQISFQPGASYIVAQLHLLANGDYFANVVQWTGFLGSIIVASLIAQHFNPNTVLLASLLCASIPMAIMQSTTTQTDLLTGFWLMCYAYWIITPAQYTWSNLGWITASLGLAIVTKATALFLAVPLSILFLWRSLLQAKPHNTYFLSSLTFITTQVLAPTLSLPHFLRNILIFGNWLGEDTDTRVSPLSLLSVLTNTLRNLALNFPFPGIWKTLQEVADSFSLALDRSSDTYGDPNSFILFVQNSNYLWTFLLPDEDRVANPLHIGLILIGLIYLSYRLLAHYVNNSQLQPSHISLVPSGEFYPIALFLCSIASFLLFSGLVKWMEWNNRLILPVLLLSTASLAYYITQTLPRFLQFLLALTLSLTGLGYSLTPIHHPLVALPPLVPKQSPSILSLDRTQRYYSGFGSAGLQLQRDYEAIADALISADCNTLGINQGIDDLEYPLWISLQARSATSRIKHVKVENPSNQATESFPDHELCAVLEHTDRGVILRAP